MSPIDNAIFLDRKNTGFSIHSGHKKAAAIVSDFVMAGGMRLHRCDADDGSGGELWRRKS